MRFTSNLNILTQGWENVCLVCRGSTSQKKDKEQREAALQQLLLCTAEYSAGSRATLETLLQPEAEGFQKSTVLETSLSLVGLDLGLPDPRTRQALALQDKKPSTNQKHCPQTRAVRVQMKPWRTRFRAVGFILSLQKDPRTKRVSLVTFRSSINLFLPSARKVVPGTDRSSPANGGCGFIAPAQRHRHR